MPAGSGFVVLIFLFALAIPIGLWLLIESETDDTPVLDRESAEQSARADTREQAERRARRDTDDEWSSGRRK